MIHLIYLQELSRASSGTERQQLFEIIFNYLQFNKISIEITAKYKIVIYGRIGNYETRH